MPTVTIACYEGRLDGGYGCIVAVDVLRAATTAVTAVALGGRCIAAASLEDAVERASTVEGALLVGELGGHRPYGFDLTNSPVAVSTRADLTAPIVLLSSSGTPLMCHAPAVADDVFAGCLRNISATATAVAAADGPAAVVGAATRGEFREEDQLCCAWIARVLFEAGYRAADAETERLVEVWEGRPVDAILESKSATYLRETGQSHDLDFVLTHVDDLPSAFRITDREIVRAP